MTTVPPPKTEPNAGAFASFASDFYQPGLTKREYFAAFIVQGLLTQHMQSNNNAACTDGNIIKPVYQAPFKDKNSPLWEGVDGLVRGAVIIADFLITELNRTAKP
jgi:hypothetical protein